MDTHSLTGNITCVYQINKFVDCAIVSNAKYIVTNDRHFNVLKEIDFPHVDVLNIDEFLMELNKTAIDRT